MSAHDFICPACRADLDTCTCQGDPHGDAGTPEPRVSRQLNVLALDAAQRSVAACRRGDVTEATTALAESNVYAKMVPLVCKLERDIARIALYAGLLNDYVEVKR